MSAEDLKTYIVATKDGPMMDIIAFECFGKFGYGDGRVLQASYHRANKQLQTKAEVVVEGGCKACGKSDECWTASVDKARMLVPELGALAKEIADEGFRGNEYMDEWCKRTGQNKDSFIPPPELISYSEMTKIGAEHTVRFQLGKDATDI